jgi:hypothetical protein
MIQPLRTVHRRAFVALALVLPAILVIGLGARRPHLLPNANATAVPAGAEKVMESSNLWKKHAIRSTIYAQPQRPLDRYVVLHPAQDLNEPDLLLYWTAEAPAGNVLPGEAQLAGVFAPDKAFLLPSSEKGAGHLVLFSPAHQGVFDTAALEKLP